MSETASTGEAPASTETPSTEPANSTETTTPSKTPADYEAMVKALREEAAANRVKGNEKAEAARAEVTAAFEAKLAEANDAHTSTKAELAKVQLTSTKVDVALEAVLGAEQAARVRAFAKTLQGTNADELKAHADELNTLFGTVQKQAQSKAVDPSQGLGGGQNPGKDGDFGAFVLSLLDK
jgi:membrane protein involved in colicin uptake